LVQVPALQGLPPIFLKMSISRSFDVVLIVLNGENAGVNATYFTKVLNSKFRESNIDEYNQ
jgi:hypothetical protein